MLLIFKSGPLEGRIVDIGRGPLTIGRVADNDLQLSDDRVSRHHAVIEMQDAGALVLRDLGSRNGTFVDGRRLAGPQVLNGGEQLRIGDQQLLVQAASLREPAPVAAPAPPVAPRADDFSPQAASRQHRLLVLVAIAIALLAAVVFGVGQLVLPGLAEQHLRSQLEHDGTVGVVEVQATPAVELLWHRADSVRVSMDSYRSQPTGGHGSLADFLSRTRETEKLDVSVATLQSRLVTLQQVSLRKEGDTLLGQAELTQAELSAALPSYVKLRPVSASTAGIVVSASAALLGLHLDVHLRVLAKGGRVVVRPEGVPFGSLATITVFADPRIYVESLGAELHGERYLLSARARLR